MVEAHFRVEVATCRRPSSVWLAPSGSAFAQLTRDLDFFEVLTQRNPAVRQRCLAYP